ncbi:hypothetical protein D915_002329 [Fasciola hepatica]|uniref:Uncharacterized protein n=1 Tax=Fasciola hepatica TaxID=6192 RepID=A0A4E0RGM8_FASHE|nr:hypothetical protein D915_002329 [Fasciola hepatica]
MHLPVMPIEQQSTALLVTYSICVITLVASIALILMFDNGLMREIRRVCCFCFCCMYGFGRFWNKRLDGDLECEDDDSADELCCFKVSESVRKKRPITLMEFDRIRRTEKYNLSDSDEDQTKRSLNRSKLFSEHTLPPLSTLKNYKQRDTVLKVRLEFLMDLAAFMSARSMQNMMSDESSSSDEESAPSHYSRSSGGQPADNSRGGNVAKKQSATMSKSDENN